MRSSRRVCIGWFDPRGKRGGEIYGLQAGLNRTDRSPERSPPHLGQRAPRVRHRVGGRTARIGGTRTSLQPSRQSADQERFAWLVARIDSFSAFLILGIGGLAVPLVLLFAWLRFRRPHPAAVPHPRKAKAHDVRVGEDLGL